MAYYRPTNFFFVNRLRKLFLPTNFVNRLRNNRVLRNTKIDATASRDLHDYLIMIT